MASNHCVQAGAIWKGNLLAVCVIRGLGRMFMVRRGFRELRELRHDVPYKKLSCYQDDTEVIYPRDVDTANDCMSATGRSILISVSQN